MERTRSICWLLLLLAACTGVQAQPAGMAGPPQRTAPAMGSDTLPDASTAWVDGGVGITTGGFMARGTVCFLVRPMLLSAGTSAVSSKAVSMTGEWERQGTVYAIAGWVLTPSYAPVMASLSAGVGMARYTERKLAPGGNWLLDPRYEQRSATVFDVPVQVTAHFAARSEVGLFVGLEAHLNREMATAGLVVGLRLAPVDP